MDLGLSWSTSDPFFNEFFEETVLVWIPFAFLIFCFPADVYYSVISKRKRGIIPWNFYNVTKCLSSLVLISIAISNTIKLQCYNGETSLATGISPPIKILSYFAALALTIISTRSGIRSSGVQFVFWLTVLCCESISFRTSVRKYQKDDDNVCPEKTSSFLSKVSFFWCESLVWKGYRNPLKQSDLWDITGHDRAAVQDSIFEKLWKIEEDKANIKSTSETTAFPSVLPVLFKAYRFNLIISGLLKLLQDLLVFTTPVLLRLLIAHVEGGDSSELWQGFVYAGLLFIVSISQTLLNAHQLRLLNVSGHRARTALNSAIFKKSLRMSNAAKKDSNLGEVVNLMSVDSERFVDLVHFVHLIWTSPIQIILVVYFLYDTLGYSGLSGVAVMILFVPINAFIFTKTRLQEIKKMTLADKRMKLTGHLLSGIKVSLVTFATYLLISSSNNLNVEKAFVALTLFNIMKGPLIMFPAAISNILAVGIGIKRINKYLNSEEVNPNAVSRGNSRDDPIVIKGGSFSWTDKLTTLKNINLKVKKGSLVAVVGRVGTGKSSLLSAILGDIRKNEGIVNISGSIAYVSQIAWIQNATVKENIVFSDKTFDREKYLEIIDACALTDDLSILPDGDNTEIGERGVTFSGGQKQRVALARAAYKESDIYLLDSPLSAVDTHVGKHIFEKLIGPNGFLKDKTRIFVTHDMDYVSQVDYIVVLKDGQIERCETREESIDNIEIIKSKTNYISELYNTNLTESEDSEVAEKTNKNSKNSKAGVVLNSEDRKTLMSKEEAKVGNVNSQLYGDYVKRAGFALSALTLSFSILFQMLAAYSNIWLSEWSKQATKDEKRNDGLQNWDTTTLYLSVFGVLGVGQIVVFAVAVVTMCLACIKSAASWHSTILSRLLKAPMSYFETTPIGRIISTFAVDISSVDVIVPIMIRSFVHNLFPVLSSIVIIAISIPASLYLIVPCCVIYIIIQRFYSNTSRQLKRLEAVSRAPIYSHFGETIAGADTIRAFNSQKYFIESFVKKSDYNLQSHIPLCSTTLWLSTRLEGIGCVIILGASFFAVAARGDVSASIAALSITSALLITQQLYYFAKVTTELENNFVAIERMKEFSKIPQESSCLEKEIPLPKLWPQRGIIKFEKYETRYREELGTVLKGISFSIKSCEKIGVVGRTGAGKSSLSLALFRVIEPTAGRILIDDVDISKIGLVGLRSNITMIPQDPVLFTGTIRFNLDPFEVKSDAAVWKCLELASLKELIQSFPEGLMYQVSEEGLNFSVGQRQLFCLARAVLNKTKILLLDEATASVDLETDNIIQKTVREEFRDSTVITIAHRLHSILDSDRVIVMDNGEITEFDTPALLLQNHNSAFARMAKSAGVA